MLIFDSILIFQYTMVDSMSENVDGYVGNKSLDYIMDFLGEKNDTDSTKKAKKQSKASKKQQKKGKGVAETEKKKQAAAKKIPPTAAKDTAAKPTDEEQKAKIPADVKKFEQQSAKPAALNTKISSDADESVPNQEAAAVVEESGDEPKSADAGDKSCFVQVEEAEVKVSDAGTSDLGGSLSQKTETAASSSVGSTPEPEADATRQPAAPRERTYHTRVFFNSKLHGGSRGYLRWLPPDWFELIKLNPEPSQPESALHALDLLKCFGDYFTNYWCVLQCHPLCLSCVTDILKRNLDNFCWWLCKWLNFSNKNHTNAK